MRINILIVISFSVLLSCGQIIPGMDGGIKTQIIKAKKNIYKAETLEDLKQKDALMDEAYNFIKQADLKINKDKNKKDPSLETDIFYGYALYFFVKGDLFQARKYIENAKVNKNFDAHVKVLETRLLLKERGAEYAKEAIDSLNYVLKNNPDMAEAYLLIGDSYNYFLDLDRARINYRKVLVIGGELQVHAAERLETLEEIEKLKLDPKQVQNIIFSKAVRRDEIADLLQRVFKIDRYLRFPKGLKEFTDISSSLNSKSIQILRSKGFFSYIESEKFEPFRNVTRREIAKMIEDFLVLSTGSEDYRSRYPKNVKSPIIDVDSSDPYYNAVRIAVKENIIDLSLGGSLQPEKSVEGLEVLGILNKLMKRFAQ